MIKYDPPAAYIAKGNLNAIKEIHGDEMIEHCGDNHLKKTANNHGLKLKEEFKVSEDCTVAKVSQRNFKSRLKRRKSITERKNLSNICSNKAESYGGSCFWALIVDDYTVYCWSLFL
jgi:hypothetical protein